MKTGVFTVFSSFRLERVSVQARSAARFLLASASSRIASTDGSSRSLGTELRNWKIAPDLARFCGARAVKRSVHVSQVSTAAHGTPSTSERSTAPPPSEMPQAPIRVLSISGRAASWSKTSRVSAISRGPSIETSPPDWPWPRRSKASTAKSLSKRCATASRSCRFSPSPWKSTIAG